MKVLVSYHNFLVQMLLGVIVLNMALHYFFSKKDFFKMVQWVRISYFLFWAVWAMVVFSGLIVFVFMKQPLTLPVIVMIISAIILPILDGYRAIKLKKIWVNEGKDGLKLSLTILLLEILVIAATTAVAIIF